MIPMKLIKVIVSPKAFPSLSTALRKARVSGITVSNVEGYGSEHLSADIDLFGHLNPRVKVEIAIDAQNCQKVIALIQSTVSSIEGDSGGTIMVSELEDVIKIPKTIS